MNAALERMVRVALQDVVDPEMGRSVIDLGLIYEIAVSDDGAVSIGMTTTVRGCPLAGFLKEAVAMAAGAAEGVTSVEVNLIYEPAWTPAMIAFS